MGKCCSGADVSDHTQFGQRDRQVLGHLPPESIDSGARSARAAGLRGLCLGKRSFQEALEAATRIRIGAKPWCMGGHHDMGGYCNGWTSLHGGHYCMGAGLLTLAIVFYTEVLIFISSANGPPCRLSGIQDL